MNLIELKFKGELSPKTKENINKRFEKRILHLKKMKEKYLNGDYDKMFSKIREK